MTTSGEKDSPEAVLLIGIPAAGKSTFCQQHFVDSHTRINLDTLKTRRRESELLAACIRLRKNFLVDNTNVLASERARYIQAAREAGYRVTGYIFTARLADALARNQLRAGKARVPEKALLHKYYQMQLPRYQEGFDKLYKVLLDPESGFAVQDWDEQPAISEK